MGPGSESDEPISPGLDELFGALHEEEQVPNIGDLPSANSTPGSHALPSASGQPTPVTPPPSTAPLSPRPSTQAPVAHTAAPEAVVYIPDAELPSAAPAAEQPVPADDYAELAARARVSVQPLNAEPTEPTLIDAGEASDDEAPFHPDEALDARRAAGSTDSAVGRRRASRNDAQPSASKKPSLDPFDTPQMGKRVGVHRAPRRRGPNWIFVMWAALVTLLLVVAGIVYIVIGVGNVKLPNPLQSSATSGQTPAAEVEPVVNPAATVTILNGTADPELAAAASSYVTTQQLGVIGNESTTETPDVTISAVFYADPADEAAALGLAAKLGGMQAHLTDSYAGLGTQLVVLIGTDLALPDAAQ
ncbi:LytR C-terminal domain-containing protein [Lysinibacter cavernae]|uniref:LytR/CpsA/Psr regulator C-terminal domain-containing protein n=1 Tax=Lysinibacter cavernae TaxID=1640652 RepID=A0A7X5R143_9MICO|nr:hypothetical protein [Lysinibacter cavernae]